MYGHGPQAADEPVDGFQPFLDEMEVPLEWWNEHHMEERRNLTAGWMKELSTRFRFAKPDGVHCSLSADWNKVYKRARKAAWRGVAYCAGRPICSRKYMFTLNRLPESLTLTLNVQGKGYETWFENLSWVILGLRWFHKYLPIVNINI